MVWEPTASVVVAKVALPVRSREPVPIVVPASAKVTVPVGVVVPEAGETVAVKVMLVPLTADVAEAVSAVDVATGTTTAFTVTVTADEVLPLKLMSPA